MRNWCQGFSPSPRPALATRDPLLLLSMVHLERSDLESSEAVAKQVAESGGATAAAPLLEIARARSKAGSGLATKFKNSHGATAIAISADGSAR